MNRTEMQTSDAAWYAVCWMSACVGLLVVACTPAPARSPVTSTASRPTQAVPITTYHGQTSTMYTVAWSPDGKHIASGGNDSTVQVWDATSGRYALTYQGHTAGVREVAWSPDGTRIASASQDGTVQVWNAVTGHLLLTYREQKSPVWAVAWSPDGTRIVSASGNTSDEKPMETVQVWDAVTGHLLISYGVQSSTGEEDGIFAVAWSPASTRIVAGGADTIVHLWNAPR